MKVAFIVFVRDKERHIASCVRSILAQTYSPMQLVFSDQGSEDNTLGVIKEIVKTYNGPNEVLVLECPDTEPKGMAGLMAHVNWLHSRLDADYWITIAGDDIAYKNRAKRTVEVIGELERKPLFFGTAQEFMDPDLTFHGVTAHPSETKWIDPIECIKDRVGGSCSGSWNPELLESFGPLPSMALIDVYLPFCAALMDKFFFLHEVHHCYIWRLDPNNTGLQGLQKQSKDETERAQFNELIQYQLAANLSLMTRVTQELDAEGVKIKNVEKILEFLYHQCMAQLGGWLETRTYLTENRIVPKMLAA